MASQTWLDRGIGWISPGWGARRARARAISSLLSFEGARTGRRTDGWITTGTSADAEVTRDLGSLRDRARSLVRDNPHAKKGLGVIVSQKIGTGILTSPNGANKRANRRTADRWSYWVDHCDYSGRLDWYGIQSLAERTRSESGEALVRILPSERKSRLDTPFRVRVLEPDHIDSSRHFLGNDGNVTRYGIEYRNHVPVAYWLFEEHPGESGTLNLRNPYESRRVPATEVIHLYKPLRAGQTRGLTDFAAVLIRLRALDDYDDAELMRKQVAACLAAFVTGPEGLPASSIAPIATDAQGRKLGTFSPGMVAHLPIGSSVTVADPKPSSDYESFNSVQLHAVAAGLEIPYEYLTGVFKEINYSSFRAGNIQFRAQIEADQWQILVPQLCRRVWERFTLEANGQDPFIDPETPATYTPPRFLMLDPSKEIPANTEALLSGQESYPALMRSLGYEWREKLAEIKESNDELDRLGIVLKGDGRNEKKESPAPADPPAQTEESDEDEAAA